MASNEQAGKIGIGPEGRMGALIQFVVVVALALAFAVYLLSPVFVVMKVMPWCLVMLVALVHLGVLGGCWPFAPPLGNWAPPRSRLIPGIGMTVIWMILTFGLLFFMMYVYPKWPLSPLFIWFGTITFWMTLLYGINWNVWPFSGKMHPWATMIAGFIVNVGGAVLVWNFTNLAGTPFENSPFDPKGPLNVNWLTGFLMWSIAWFTIFNPVFTTQGTPFGKLGHPGGAIAQTILAHVLGYACWTGSLALGLPPTFSIFAVATSLIFVAYVHSWMFSFWGVTKLTAASRAVAAFVLQVILTGGWILFARVVLGPFAAKAAELKLPVDINVLTLYLSLAVILPILIAHNIFWLRWPLTLPNPPGTPPPNVAE